MAAKDADPARLDQIHEQLQRRRLARAIGSQQRQDAALRHVEVQFVHRFRPSVAPREIVGGDGIHVRGVTRVETAGR